MEKLNKIVKFMRHEFTETQVTAMLASVNGERVTIDMTEEASQSLNTPDDVEKMVQKLRNQIDVWHERLMIFGVVPAPLMEGILKNSLPCQVFQAWNVRRSVEGEKPTFEFQKWCLTYSAPGMAESLEEERVERLFATKMAEGWQRFEFFSSYYGSHEEYGEGDCHGEYIFAPHIEIPSFEGGFSHGHHSRDENNAKFSQWLETLKEGRDYLERELD